MGGKRNGLRGKEGEVGGVTGRNRGGMWGGCAKYLHPLWGDSNHKKLIIIEKISVFSEYILAFSCFVLWYTVMKRNPLHRGA